MTKGKKSIEQVNNEDLLNVIKQEASPELKNTLDVGMRSGEGIQGLGLALTTYTASMNEFLNVLVNKIGRQIISSKMARNKLAAFKGESMQYGKDIEEIFVSLLTKKSFDQSVAETEVFKREIPNTKAIFHRQNRQDFYKTTISNEILRRAFYSPNGLGKLIGNITDQLYSSSTNDEFQLMKELATEYTANFVNVTVSAPIDTATTKALAQAIKLKVLQMGFMSTLYNKQNVTTFSDPGDLVLLMSPDVAVQMNTELLAYAFNQERVDFDTQTIVVDNFGTGLATAKAILVDKEWFRVFDTLQETNNIYNPQGLFSNIFFHHHQVLSTNQFANAVAFKTA